MAEQEPPQDEVGEAEFAARLEEELKRLKISDVLVQTLYTISSLGYHKLGTDHRDLPQARLAIDSLRALLPVLKDDAPAEVVRDFEQVVANMQLAYSDAVKEERPPKDSPPTKAEPEPIEDEELGGEG